MYRIIENDTCMEVSWDKAICLSLLYQMIGKKTDSTASQESNEGSVKEQERFMFPQTLYG